MKIGILTFHRARNYGGVLQCYALMRFLQGQGYNVEVVDYRCPQIESVHKVLKSATFKEVINSVRFGAGRIKAEMNFKDFRDRYLKISDQIYRTASDFDHQYDVCVVGSDQVWSTRLVGGFDPVYFGAFSPAIRKVGYAVSTAVDQRNYDSSEQRAMASYVDNFSHFSTREDSLREILCQYTEKPIATVVDPSLLLDRESYSAIAETPREKDYVLYYQQEYHPDTKELVQDIARQTGARNIVVVTGCKERYEMDHSYYDTSSLSVPMFLGLFKHARAVLTSSFHGTAFSLIFRKNFYFVANNAPDRARCLLRHIGAEDRLVNPGGRVSFSEVDYLGVAPSLDAYRELSMRYLLDAIEN